MEQYKKALEHISVRAGTAIPTGAAEGALAALYQRREEAWPFLAEHLSGGDVSQKERQPSPKSGLHTNSTQVGKGDAGGEGERPAAFEPDGAETATSDGTGQREERGIGQRRQRTGRVRENKRNSSSSTTSSGDEAIPESFSLESLSVALEAFACTCEERGSALQGLAVQDLRNFLYLDGQAKAGSQYRGTLDSGSFLRIDYGTDGSSLWHALKEENRVQSRHYLASSGRHSVFGVSADAD